MTTNWTKDAIFYHIYPLGLVDAPHRNDFDAPVIHRLDQLLPWVDHIGSLGANAIYLGPVFESTSHGYDTVDYYRIDRRLGDIDTMARLAQEIHERGLRLVLDGVFNHVGRDSWAFKDLQAHGENSAYRDWFHNLRFDGQSPMGDPFTYEGWHGHYSLVKLNLEHPDVRAHLFDAVGMWMEKFGIDGLRLDAADSIDFDFLRALRDFTKNRRSDFWLMGEVVHGDYRQWANSETLDSVTNYEAYKGLYSSLNDGNYFEIAHTLQRQSGEGGLYQGVDLYNFVDNHDVNRVASRLKNKAHLFPLYFMLFTMPGIPSIYYGSEWGIEGVKAEHSDLPLRPALDIEAMRDKNEFPELSQDIRRLAQIRKNAHGLKYGKYRQVFVAERQFAFERISDEEKLLVVINSAEESAEIEMDVSWAEGRLRDVLNGDTSFTIKAYHVRLDIPAMWGRILKFEG
jgi:glycosidase